MGDINMEERNYKQVIVIRKDLNMRKGKLAAQVAHGSMAVLLDHMDKFTVDGYTYREMILDVDHPINKWLEGRFVKIVVYVNSELELLTLRDECEYREVSHALIKDAGFTEFKEPTFTCLAVGPEHKDKIDIITGDLPLL